MKGLNRIVRSVIRESDIIIEVLDARFVDETRNRQSEEEIESLGKPLIFALTKADIAQRKNLEMKRKGLPNSIIFSSKDRVGTKDLIEKIIKVYNEFYPNKYVTVGVIGYPNVGKSSLINALKHRKVAGTSSISGYTTKKKLIKIRRNIYLMDTPGVFPQEERSDEKFVYIAAKDPTKVDAQTEAKNLLRKLGGKIEAFYGIENMEDKELVLENLAKKFNRYARGGVPDKEVISRKIISEWQKGKIKV